MHSYPQTRLSALSSPFELAQPAPSAPSSHGVMVSVDSSARAAGPDAVAIGRKRNVVKMRRVQAIGNGQPIIGNGPCTLSGKRPTAAALRLERLDRSAVPPSRDIVVRDYDAFMAERVRLAAAEAGTPGKEEAHTIAAPASTAPASPAFPPLPLAQGGWRVTPWILALDPHGAPCRTSPSVELHATLVSAPIQAELEASQHVYAEQWARPPVQWGNVQWDRSLEIAIAAELSKIAIANELSQLPRGRTAASQGARRMLTYPATCPIKGTRAAFLGVQCF